MHRRERAHSCFVGIAQDESMLKGLVYLKAVVMRTACVCKCPKSPWWDEGEEDEDQEEDEDEEKGEDQREEWTRRNMRRRRTGPGRGADIRTGEPRRGKGVSGGGARAASVRQDARRPARSRAAWSCLSFTVECWPPVVSF